MGTKLAQKTQTKIAPHLVLVGVLLHASSAELEQLIRQEVADNPALEMENDHSTMTLYGDHRSVCRNSDAINDISHGLERIYVADDNFDENDPIENIATQSSVIEALTRQVRLLTDGVEAEVAVQLLHRLDGHGYLRVSHATLAEELAVDKEVVIRAVKVLHELEPPGIGAHDARECLLIQCAFLREEGVDCELPERILTEAWDELASQQWKRTARRLGVPEASVDDAVRFIASNLYPYPLCIIPESISALPYLRPEFVIIRQQNADKVSYLVEMPEANAYNLSVNSDFASLANGKRNNSEQLSSPECNWLERHVEHARLFIASLEQRRATLEQIVRFLVQYQRDFLTHGPRYLQPLTRAQVAVELGIHAATVSRAISGKHAVLPDGGLVPLSIFFDQSLPIKNAISAVLAQSGRSLSDREIAEQLQANGWELARRTVTKYRKKIGVPTDNRQ